MKYFLITGKIPANENEPERDHRIEIGISNVFDSSGKPFKVQYHPELGITTLEDWKRLLHIYGDKITHEYIVTLEGLRQDRQSEVVPAHHLIAMLNDGFSKSGMQVPGKGDVVIYTKQKGRIEDESGKIYSADEMILILGS